MIHPTINHDNKNLTSYSMSHAMNIEMTNCLKMIHNLISPNRQPIKIEKFRLWKYDEINQGKGILIVIREFQNVL